MGIFSQSMKETDLVIGIRYEIENIKDKFRTQKTNIKKQINDLDAAIKKSKQRSTVGPEGAGMMTFKGQTKSTEEFKAQLEELRHKLKVVGVKEAKKLDPLKKQLTGAKHQLDQTNQSMKKAAGQFPAWAMSIMFMGMALFRVFQSVWRSASETFREIRESSDGATNGFAMLEGSLKYLGFTVGQALEPIAYMLIPIVDRFAEWVSQNQRTATSIALVVGVIAPLLMLIGQVTLGLNGLLIFGKKLILTFTKIGFVIKSVAAIIVAIATLPAWAIAVIVAAVVGFIAFLVWGFKGGFKKIADFFSKWGKKFRSRAADIWGGVKDSLGDMLTGARSLFGRFFSWVLDRFIGLIKGINKVPGINIGTSGIESLRDRMNSWEKGAQTKPDSRSTATSPVVNNNNITINEKQGENSKSVARDVVAEMNRSSRG